MAARWMIASQSRAASFTSLRSRTSPRTNSKLGLLKNGSSGSPPYIRLSSTRTRCPSSRRSGTSAVPTNPAPPVTRIFISSHSPFRVLPAGADGSDDVGQVVVGQRLVDRDGELAGIEGGLARQVVAQATEHRVAVDAEVDHRGGNTGL